MNASLVGATVHVARFELLRHARHPRFLTATFAIPLLIGTTLAMIATGARLAGGPDRPWAIVGPGDVAGATVRMATEGQAEVAVRAAEIGGYVVLRPGGRALARASGDVPPELASALFERSLDEAVSHAPEAVQDRVREPADVLYAPLGSVGDPVPAAVLFARSAAAVALPLFFALAVLSSTSYLVQAISEEKESRVIEVLATTVPPPALIAGKVVGLGLLSLIQTTVWAGGALAAAAATGRLPALPQMPWGALLLSLPFFVLGYLLYATVMVGVGVIVGSPREAQQLAGFVGMFLVLPFALVGLLVVRPSSPAAVALSVFPATAPIAMPMRLVMGAAPAATYALSLIGVSLALLACIYAVARVYRAAMLLFGQRMSVGAIVRALAA
jgi:ABC-2 type transport system permease protein